MVEIVCRLVCQENFAQNDDQILVAAGVPLVQLEEQTPANC